MKRKSYLAVLLACAMAVTGLAGCGGNDSGKKDTSAAGDNLPVDEEGNPGPFGKYKEPITVEIVQSINPTLPIPEGESATDNYYTRYVKENMNIDTKVKWSASNADYTQKLNLAIASNDLPDILEMYQDGILDQEIGVRKDADEAWKGGKAGILFSPWWNGYNVKDGLANDPEADWQAFAGPLAEDGQWYPKQGGVGGSFCVVRKGYEHPEAAFVLNSFLRRDEGKFAAETKLDAGYYPGRVVITPYDECSFSVEALRAKMDGEEVPEYDPINYKLLDHDFETLEQCLQPPYDDLRIGSWDQTPTDFGRLYSLLKGYECVVDAKEEGIVNQTYSLIYSQTETMEKKWANLKKKEDEVFLKIIIGEASLDDFDTFVKEWKAEGGDEITAEVQETMKK